MSFKFNIITTLTFLIYIACNAHVFAKIEIRPIMPSTKQTFSKEEFTYDSCMNKNSNCNKMLRAVCDGSKFTYYSYDHPLSKYVRKLNAQNITCNVFQEYLKKIEFELIQYYSSLSDKKLCDKTFMTGRDENFYVNDLDMDTVNSYYSLEMQKRNLNCDVLYAKSWTDDYVCLMKDVNENFKNEVDRRGLNCKSNDTKEKKHQFVNKDGFVIVNVKLENNCLVNDDVFLVSIPGTDMRYKFKDKIVRLRLKSGRKLQLISNPELSFFKYSGMYVDVDKNVVLSADCEKIASGQYKLLDDEKSVSDKLYEQKIELEEETRKEKFKRIAEEKKRKELEKRIAELEKKNKLLQTSKNKSIPSFSSDVGSGFYVSKLRHVVTNQHVVDKCKKITVGYDNASQIKADLVAFDKRNDLAILQTSSMEMASAEEKSFLQKLKMIMPNIVSKGLMRLEDVSGGEEIFVAGFPLGTSISDEMKLDDGIVRATKGMDNDVTQFIISSDIQKGNSGGPIYDKTGNIVGMAVSRFVNKNDKINFAIKGSTIKQFLSANDIPTKWANKKEEMDTKDIYQLASKQTVMVVCHN